MNNSDLARLRRRSIERGDKGGPDSRDSLIKAFLTHLGEVVCDEAIATMADHVLDYMYTRWVQAVMAGEDEDERKRRLISSIYFNPFAEPGEKPADNVKPLFG